ncbi:unnamed protein product [Cunninghamella blakesleeana]
MSGLCIIGNYVFFFLLTPYLAQTHWLRQSLLPSVGNFLSISKVPIDELLFCVGFITLFVFVFLHMVIDLLRVAKAWGLLTDNTTGHTLEGFTIIAATNSTRLTIRLENAQQYLSQLYPAFITSAVLLWANTNKFDSYSITFILIQGVFFTIMPFTYICSHPIINHINRIAYQSALAWSIIYALFPRDAGFVIDIYVRELTQLFTPNPTDAYVAIL